MSKPKNNEITIIFTSDHNSAQNVEALDFFRGALPSIVNKGFFINFVIAYTSEKEKYDKMGIKSFPASIYNNNVVSTIAKIKELFNALLKNNKPAKKSYHKEDEMGSYLKEEILNQGDSEDLDESEYTSIEKDRAKKMQSELARRKIPSSGQKATPVPKKPRQGFSINASSSTNTSTSDVLASLAGNDADDALMSKFYENLEETTI